MQDKTNFDVIIIGGSYAGLSAAMALGRSLRQVLVIDSGKPCNRQTPHSHNFITQDGRTPGQITEDAKKQVLAYNTISFYNGLALSGSKTENGFTISTDNDESFSATKLLFATGVTDLMPPIQGFSECWGISVLHCPYCHGYEVRHQPLGVLGNGDMGFEFGKFISNWSQDLVLFTNGQSTLTEEQEKKLTGKNIRIIQSEIAALEHTNGNLQQVQFKDGSSKKIAALFARTPFSQHCTIPEQLGCQLNEQGYLAIDDFQRTTVPGVYAAGDNTTMFRSVSAAVAAGTKAGAMLNKELVDERFL
ncbi:NAD(P)/FAD-dependent oxidoreductase [Botryobacter ruber]|uniref:NAD(P)/FAD-dependent oxidoreductase n=1 Tax=Botryobacter ruber TaxID=2171629 RepID=UPI000E0C0864|nr:NAD(P)/FAD-dependent oxidoreductase [Botryobacter ruber]